MNRDLAWFALGCGIAAASRLAPEWLAGAMRVMAGMVMGAHTMPIARELRDRAAMRLRWWRTRRNGRRGRGHAGPAPYPGHINCRCTIKRTERE